MSASASTSRTGADLLRRQPDGSWPEDAARIVSGEPVLESIGLVVTLSGPSAGPLPARPPA